MTAPENLSVGANQNGRGDAADGKRLGRWRFPPGALSASRPLVREVVQPALDDSFFEGVARFVNAQRHDRHLRLPGITLCNCQLIQLLHRLSTRPAPRGQNSRQTTLPRRLLRRTLSPVTGSSTQRPAPGRQRRAARGNSNGLDAGSLAMRNVPTRCVSTDTVYGSFLTPSAMRSVSPVSVISPDSGTLPAKTGRLSVASVEIGDCHEPTGGRRAIGLSHPDHGRLVPAKRVEIQRRVTEFHRQRFAGFQGHTSRRAEGARVERNLLGVRQILHIGLGLGSDRNEKLTRRQIGES